MISVNDYMSFIHVFVCYLSFILLNEPLGFTILFLYTKLSNILENSKIDRSFGFFKSTNSGFLGFLLRHWLVSLFKVSVAKSLFSKPSRYLVDD